jgi:hypothetical protein
MLHRNINHVAGLRPGFGLQGDASESATGADENPAARGANSTSAPGYDMTAAMLPRASRACTVPA